MSQDKSIADIVPRQLLGVKRFQDDFRHFLTLSPTILETIARLSNDADGFYVSKKAPVLSKETGLSPEKSNQAMVVARYLYDTVSEKRVPVAETVQILISYSKSIDSPLSTEQGHAIEKILSYKKAYEEGSYARNHVVHSGPHFIELEGSWSIKIYRTRENENVKVPVLSLSMSWHDRHGNDHESFVQMTETDWEELKQKIEDISKAHKQIKELFEK